MNANVVVVARSKCSFGAFNFYFDQFSPIFRRRWCVCAEEKDVLKEQFA